jgi:hypothetical protein
VASESATQIVLKHPDGTTVNVDPKQVKQRTVAPSSMPEIYAQVLTRTQLRDVVAFLHALDRAASPGEAEPAPGQSNRAMQSVVKEGAAGGHP